MDRNFPRLEPLRQKHRTVPTLYRHDNKPDGLTHSSIWCIVKDEQGTLWLGTYFMASTTSIRNMKSIPAIKWETRRKKDYSPIVGRMTEDKDGNLWICTEGGGVNVYNRKTILIAGTATKKARTVSRTTTSRQSITTGQRRLCGSAHTWEDWNKLDLRTNRFTVYRMKAGDPTTLPSDIVRDIVPYEDKLIIATQNGVCLFNPATAPVNIFSRIPKKAEISVWWPASISTRMKRYGFPLPERAYILPLRHRQAHPLCTQSLHSEHSQQQQCQQHHARQQRQPVVSPLPEVLDRYRKESNDFENFDMQKDGLSSDCIHEVFESSIQKGDLLLITNQDSPSLTIRKKKFYNYGTENGFPLTAVNENALFVTHDGEVFLGGIQGMISFWEKKLHFTPKSQHHPFPACWSTERRSLPETTPASWNSPSPIHRKSA